MKKAILFILVLVGFFSCKMVYDIILDESFLLEAEDHELYYGDFGEINNLSDIATWIRENIELSRQSTSWADPQETVEKGYGDCEDIALLFLNIAYVELGIKGSICLVNTNNRDVENGGTPNHAVAIVSNKYFDPILYGFRYYDNIMYKYSFDTIFKNF